MFSSQYEYEKRAKVNYDNIREYCLMEQVNEEHLRTAIKRNKKLGNKLTKKSRLYGILLIIKSVLRN